MNSDFVLGSAASPICTVHFWSDFKILEIVLGILAIKYVGDLDILFKKYP